MSHPSTWPGIAMTAIPDGGLYTFVDTDGVTKTIPMTDFKKRLLSTGDISWMPADVTNVDTLVAGDRIMVWQASTNKMVKLTRNALLNFLLGSEDLSWMAALSGGVDTAADKLMLIDADASGKKLRTVSVGSLINTSGFEFNVVSFGATGDGVTNDAPYIQACIDALPSTGGTVYFPPGTYLINSTLTITNRHNIRFYGRAMAADSNLAANRPMIRFNESAGGWSTATPMFLITTSTAPSSDDSWRGYQFEGLALKGHSSNYLGGHGIIFKKYYPVAGNNFTGQILVRDCSLTCFNTALGFDDQDGAGIFANGGQNGSGYGWVTVDHSNIQVNVYGIRSNCTINIINITNSQVWQNKPVTSSLGYHTRTGCGIYLLSGTGLTVSGVDLEGNQVGIQTGMSNVKLINTYYEACVDAGIVLIGAHSVSIDVASASGNNNDRQIYCYNTNGVTLKQGGYFANAGSDYRMYIVQAPHCRDIQTDTPLLTRFSSTEAGSFTLSDRTVWVRSECVPIPMRAAKESHRLMTGLTKTSLNSSNQTTQSWYGIRSPHGTYNKLTRATAAANYGGVQFDYGSVNLEIGQYAILSAWVRVDATNAGLSGNFVYGKLIVDGGTPVWEGTFSGTYFPENEWLQVRAICKENSGGYRTYSLFVGSAASGDFLDVAFPSMIIARTPDIDGYGEVVGNTQRYLFDGADYYGSAKPTDTTQTWLAGDKVFNTAPTASGSVGWICTTGGSPGTWKEFGVIEA